MMSSPENDTVIQSEVPAPYAFDRQTFKHHIPCRCVLSPSRVCNIDSYQTGASGHKPSIVSHNNQRHSYHSDKLQVAAQISYTLAPIQSRY